jgi:hypothetical protein
MARGGSAIVGPLGEYLAGPLWDEAGILYAHIDPGAVTEARFDFDAAGHYSRPDLFEFAVAPSVNLPDLPGTGLLDDLILGGGNSPLGALTASAAPFLDPYSFDDDDQAVPAFPIGQAFPVPWAEKSPAASAMPPRRPKPPRPKRARRRE